MLPNVRFFLILNPQQEFLENKTEQYFSTKNKRTSHNDSQH